MNTIMVKKVILFILFFGSAFAISAQQKLVNVNQKGVVMEGYDPVSYFINGTGTPGSEEYKSSYNGLTYYFSSPANKNTFDTMPSKYEVQFGGFCAYAVSQGHVSPIDPNYCVVQTDNHGKERLICQHNQKAADLWHENPDELLINAFTNWPEVMKNGGKQINIKGSDHFFVNVESDGLANQGYDVVSYFVKGQAEKGDLLFKEWYHGVRYHFISADHQELFRKDPGKFIPQYGGFCGYAMSLGKVRPVDPTIFQIVNGRLILQHTVEAYRSFNANVDQNISKADKNWPVVEAKHAGKRIKFDKPAVQ